MAKLTRSRKVRLAQSAIVGMRQVIADAATRHNPVLDQASADLRLLHTDIISMLALGLARFIGEDEELIENPVSTSNWRHRLGAPRAWAQMTEKECEDGQYLFARDTLTPDEFTRVRAIIEKLERLQRQANFQFAVAALDPLQEDLKF